MGVMYSVGEQLSTDYEQFCQIIIDMRSQMDGMYSVGKLVNKIFTDRIIILHRQKISIGKTIKCCSVQ